MIYPAPVIYPQLVNGRPKREDQSRNGVRVVVYRYASGGSWVDADCQCFGSTGRLHSNPDCPLLRRG